MFSAKQYSTFFSLLISIGGDILLFPEKEAKSVVLLRRRSQGLGLLFQLVEIVFFFQKKKQKALFCFAEGHRWPNLREAEPRGLGLAPEETRQRFHLVEIVFFFQKKKQKALFCFAEGPRWPKPPRSGATGSGAGPRKDSSEVSIGGDSLLFPEKEAKSVVLLRRRSQVARPSAKRSHGVWGWPQKKDSSEVHSTSAKRNR
jgi:hypothetical protein